MTTTTDRFAAVSYDAEGEPCCIWLGSAEACARFARREEEDDGRTVTITEADEAMTWDSLRDSVWPWDGVRGHLIGRIVLR